MNQAQICLQPNDDIEHLSEAPAPRIEPPAWLRTVLRGPGQRIRPEDVIGAFKHYLNAASAGLEVVASSGEDITDETRRRLAEGLYWQSLDMYGFYELWAEQPKDFEPETEGEAPDADLDDLARRFMDVGYDHLPAPKLFGLHTAFHHAIRGNLAGVAEALDRAALTKPQGPDTAEAECAGMDFSEAADLVLRIQSLPPAKQKALRDIVSFQTPTPSDQSEGLQPVAESVVAEDDSAPSSTPFDRVAAELAEVQEILRALVDWSLVSQMRSQTQPVIQAFQVTVEQMARRGIEILSTFEETLSEAA